MRTLLATLILAVAGSFAVAKPETTNPFDLDARIEALPKGDSLRSYYAGLRSAVFRDGAGAEREFGRFLADEKADREYKLMALQHLGGSYMREGRNEDAVRVFRRCLKEFDAQFDENERRGLGQTLSIVEALSKAPPVEAVSVAETKLPIRHDKMGLARVPATVNGISCEVLWDTGANLCTVSEAFAKRCGFSFVEGAVEVAASTGKAVAGRMGVLEKLELGNCTLRNVACLVLPDSMLSFPEHDYSIDAVIGFPVIEKLGFIRFESRDSVTFGLPHVERDASPSLALIGYTPYVCVSYKGKRLPFILDSGAVKSGLNSRFASIFPEIKEEGKEQDGSIGGAGGSIAVKTVILPKLAYSVGGRDVELRDVKLILEALDGSTIQVGDIGSDLLFSGHGYELDLMSMHFRLLP